MPPFDVSRVDGAKRNKRLIASYPKSIKLRQNEKNQKHEELTTNFGILSYTGTDKSSYILLGLLIKRGEEVSGLTLGT